MEGFKKKNGLLVMKMFIIHFLCYIISISNGYDVLVTNLFQLRVRTLRMV